MDVSTAAHFLPVFDVCRLWKFSLRSFSFCVLLRRIFPHSLFPSVLLLAYRLDFVFQPFTLSLAASLFISAFFLFFFSLLRMDVFLLFIRRFFLLRRLKFWLILAFRFPFDFFLPAGARCVKTSLSVASATACLIIRSSTS